MTRPRGSPVSRRVPFVKRPWPSRRALHPRATDIGLSRSEAHLQLTNRPSSSINQYPDLDPVFIPHTNKLCATNRATFLGEYAVTDKSLETYRTFAGVIDAPKWKIWITASRRSEAQSELQKVLRDEPTSIPSLLGALPDLGEKTIAIFKETLASVIKDDDVFSAFCDVATRKY